MAASDSGESNIMKKLLITSLMGLGFISLGAACGSSGGDLCPGDPAKIDPGACGCGIPDTDLDGNGTFDCQEVDGTITASWTLVSGDNNDPAACPAGATTVALISQDSLGEQTTDLFDCAAGGGTTAPLVADNYLAWIQVTDDTGAVLYAQSLSTDVPVAPGADTPVTFEVSLDRGSFTLAWEIQEAGAPSDCATVGGTTVSLVSTDINTDFWEDRWDCPDGGGSSAGLALGTYTESVSLLDNPDPNVGLAIAVADAVEASLDYGNHYYDLGLFILDTAAP